MIETRGHSARAAKLKHTRHVLHSNLRDCVCAGASGRRDTDARRPIAKTTGGARGAIDEDGRHGRLRAPDGS